MRNTGEPGSLVAPAQRWRAVLLIVAALGLFASVPIALHAMRPVTDGAPGAHVNGPR